MAESRVAAPYRSLVRRGWRIRFRASPQLGSLLKHWTTVETWGIDHGIEIPPYQIARIGPVFIDRLPNRRKMVNRLFDMRRAVTYWSERCEELEKNARMCGECRRVMDATNRLGPWS